MMSILTLYLIFFHSKGLKETREKPILKEQCWALKNNSRMTGKELITIRVPNYTQWTKKSAFLMNDMNLAFCHCGRKKSPHD